MSVRMFTVSRLLSASPLGDGERTKARGSRLVRTLPNPHSILLLEKGEVNPFWYPHS